MHIRIKRQQPAQIGRSLVEMLGVLAVIGVLSVLGLVGYSYAMEKWRENETLNYYSKIVAGARTGRILQNQGWHTLYELVDGYETQKGALEPQRIGMSEVISNVDIIPCTGGDCAQAPLKGPFNAFNRPRKGMEWDAGDEKEVEIWVNVQSPKAFTVHAVNLTMGACKKIVQADLGYDWAFQNAVRHVSESDEKNGWITPDALMDDVMAEALCLGAATQNGLVLWFGPYDCYTSQNCQIPPVKPTPVCGPESEDYCYTDSTGPVCCGNCVDDDGDGNGDRCGEIPPVICTVLSPNYCYSDDDGPHCCQSGACLDTDKDGAKDACACPSGKKWCSGDVNNPVCCQKCYDNNADGVYESCGPDNEMCDGQPTCTVSSDCEDENAICSDDGCCVTIPECAEGEQLYCAEDRKSAPDCSGSYCIWSTHCTKWACTAAELLQDPTLARDVASDENPGWRDRMGLGDSYARDREIPMTGAMEGKYPYCSYALRIPVFGVSRCALVSYCDEEPVDIGNGMQACPACGVYDNTTQVCVGNVLKENFDVLDGVEALIHYRPKYGPWPRCDECVDGTDCGDSGWICRNGCCELEEICSSNMKCESDADCVVSQEVADKNGWETQGICQDSGCCKMVDCVDECAKKGLERKIGGGCCPPERSWYNCGNCAAQPHEMNSCGEYVPAAKACCDGPSQHAPSGCSSNGLWRETRLNCQSLFPHAPCCYDNYPDSNNQCCAWSCLADGSVSSTNPVSVCCNEGAGDKRVGGVCCKAGVAKSAHCCTQAFGGKWAPTDVTVSDDDGVLGACCMPVPGQTPLAYVPYGKNQAVCADCPAGETNPVVYPQGDPHYEHTINIKYPVVSAMSYQINEGFVCCSDALGPKEAYMDDVTGQLSCCHPNSFVPDKNGNVFGPYKVGTCCPTGVTYTTSSGGNTGVSGTACCPTASVFTNTSGASACCLDANGQLQKTYKDENGVEQCCQAPDLPYKNDKGQDDCCPAANVYTDSNNNKQCCSDGTIIKDGNGNQSCCPTEKLYTDSNNVQQCCLSGVVYTNDYGNQDCCPPEQWDATNEMCAIMPVMTTLPETDTPGSDTPGTDTPGTDTPDSGTPDSGTPSSYTPETTTPWGDDDEDVFSSSNLETPDTYTPETTTPNSYDTVTDTPDPYGTTRTLDVTAPTEPTTTSMTTSITTTPTTTETPNSYDTVTDTPDPYGTTTTGPGWYETTTSLTHTATPTTTPTVTPMTTTPTSTPSQGDTITSASSPYDTTTTGSGWYETTTSLTRTTTPTTTPTVTPMTTTGTPNPYGTTTTGPSWYETTTSLTRTTTPMTTTTPTSTPSRGDTTTSAPSPYGTTTTGPSWYETTTSLTRTTTPMTTTTTGTPNPYDTMTTAPSWYETTTSLTRTATPTTTSLTRTATPTTTTTGTPNPYDTMTTAPSWYETTTSLTRTTTPMTTTTPTSTPSRGDTTTYRTGTPGLYDTATGSSESTASGMCYWSGWIDRNDPIALKGSGDTESVSGVCSSNEYVANVDYKILSGSSNGGNVSVNTTNGLVCTNRFIGHVNGQDYITLCADYAINVYCCR